MANTNQADRPTGLADHEYNWTALTEACDEVEIEEMLVGTDKTRYEHTPLPSPNPKKARKAKDKSKQADEITNEVIFDAIQTLFKR